MPSARDPELVYRIFGRRLRQLRLGRDLNQDELAALSGLTRTSIANIESGRQRVLLHQLLYFAEALGVGIDGLLPQSSHFVVPEKNVPSSVDEYLKRVRGLAALTPRKRRTSQ